MSINFYGLQFDTIQHLPFTPRLQAIYVNGHLGVQKPRYGRGRVYIDVTGAAPDKAYWLDVESLDATPARVPGWLDDRQRLVNSKGGIYCDRHTLPAVIRAAAGRKFDLWLATLDGTALPRELDTLPPNVNPVVIQAFPSAMDLVGFDVDISVVIDGNYWRSRAL